MKYYTFLPQFHQAIRKCVKVSTIRGKAKVKTGERFALRFWTGRPYGSPMGWLGTAVCTDVLGIVISRHQPGDWIRFEISGIELTYGARELLAADEGFADGEAMASHFLNHHTLPLSGVLTRWDPASFTLPTATDHRTDAQEEEK